MTEERVPLFVRLPQEQAVALDRLVGQTGRRKQQLVSELLADRLEVGRVEIHEQDAEGVNDVLTLVEVAELLRLPVDAVRERTLRGELPARRFGQEWRYSSRAVMAWLAAGESGADAEELGSDERDG